MIGPAQPSTTTPRPRVSYALPREGKYWLLAGIILVVTGWFRAINLILLLGNVMLLLWALNFYLAGRRLHRLRARRRVPGAVFAATPFPLEIEVENTGRKSRMGLLLEARQPDHDLSRFFLCLGGRERVQVRQEVCLARRGRYDWQPLRVTSGYPFGLVRRGVTVVAGEESVVLPRLGRLHRGRLRCFLRRSAPGLSTRRQMNQRRLALQTEFHGLREFRSGDSPRWIHWRTSARRGELMVREFEDTPNDNLVLVVEAWKPAGERVEPFAPLEEALSLAATVCWEWCRQGGDELVLAIAGSATAVWAGTTGRDHALRTLGALAVEEGSPAPDAGRLVDRLAAVELPVAPVLVIGCRPTPLSDFLGQRLHRPVAFVDASRLSGQDFYERVNGHVA